MRKNPAQARDISHLDRSLEVLFCVPVATTYIVAYLLLFCQYLFLTFPIDIVSPIIFPTIYSV